jgi:hypothetical protein
MGVNNMGRRYLTERDLLEGLDVRKAHAVELAEPLPQELEHLDKLRGSIKIFGRPLDSFEGEFFDSAEPCTNEYLQDRDQLERGR